MSRTVHAAPPGRRSPSGGRRRAFLFRPGGGANGIRTLGPSRKRKCRKGRTTPSLEPPELEKTSDFRGNRKSPIEAGRARRRDRRPNNDCRGNLKFSQVLVTPPSPSRIPGIGRKRPFAMAG